MKIIITESQYNFMKRRLSYIDELLGRELKDAEPCYYKKRFGEGNDINWMNPLESYKESVISSVSEFIIQQIPNFFDMEEDDEIKTNEMIQNFLLSYAGDIISEYFENTKCD